MPNDSAPSLRLLARRINDAEQLVAELGKALGLIDGCLASRDYNSASRLAKLALRQVQTHSRRRS